MVYLNSVVTLNGAIYSRVLGSPGNLTFTIWYQILRLCRTKKKSGTYMAKKATLIFSERTDKFEPLRLFAILLEGFFSVLNLALVMATL